MAMHPLESYYDTAKALPERFSLRRKPTLSELLEHTVVRVYGDSINTKNELFNYDPFKVANPFKILELAVTISYFALDRALQIGAEDNPKHAIASHTNPDKIKSSYKWFSDEGKFSPGEGTRKVLRGALGIAFLAVSSPFLIPNTLYETVPYLGNKLLSWVAKKWNKGEQQTEEEKVEPRQAQASVLLSTPQLFASLNEHAKLAHAATNPVAPQAKRGREKWTPSPSRTEITPYYVPNVAVDKPTEKEEEDLSRSSSVDELSSNSEGTISSNPSDDGLGDNLSDDSSPDASSTLFSPGFSHS
jgi:hypothetical protein